MEETRLARTFHAPSSEAGDPLLEVLEEVLGGFIHVHHTVLISSRDARFQLLGTVRCRVNASCKHSKVETRVTM